MFGMIYDLPIPERYFFRNMITFFLIGHSNPNINEFIKRHMKKLNQIVKNGLVVDKMPKLKIKIAGFIADAPATAKALNTIQFNGYFGCIKCLSKGERCEGKMVHRFSSDLVMRTPQIYKEQVKFAEENQTTYKGIKGASSLNEYLDLPDNSILDYVHLCCLGTMDQLLNLWLFEKTNSNNEINEWYLG